MTFDDLQKHTLALATKIKSSGASYQSLVAIGRGGMGIAAMLSHALGIDRCHYVDYSRARGWQGDSFGGAAPAHALWVDDAAETGGSFVAMNGRYGAFDTAAICLKPDCSYPVTYHVFTSANQADFVMPFELKAG